MPVQPCISGGKNGYKWGDKGKCYTYNLKDKAAKKRAYDKAAEQGRAIKAGEK